MHLEIQPGLPQTLKGSVDPFAYSCKTVCPFARFRVEPANTIPPNALRPLAGDIPLAPPSMCTLPQAVMYQGVEEVVVTCSLVSLVTIDLAMACSWLCPKCRSSSPPPKTADLQAVGFEPARDRCPHQAKSYQCTEDRTGLFGRDSW